MLHMASKHYIPTVISYTTELAASISTVQDACPEADVSTQKELLMSASSLLAQARSAQLHLQTVSAKVNAMQNVEEMANAIHDEVVPAMKALRAPIDALELIVDKSIWPVPTYGDLMFEV